MVDRLFDIVICALLVATIVHLFLVQRRLRAFRAERDRLQAFVTALDLTVKRAESAIRRMRPLTGAEPSEAQAKPKAVRERAPEDLLRAARAAAGVGGQSSERAQPTAKVRKGADAGAKSKQGAATLADALSDAVGG